MGHYCSQLSTHSTYLLYGPCKFHVFILTLWRTHKEEEGQPHSSTRLLVNHSQVFFCLPRQNLIKIQRSNEIFLQRKQRLRNVRFLRGEKRSGFFSLGDIRVAWLFVICLEYDEWSSLNHCSLLQLFFLCLESSRATLMDRFSQIGAQARNISRPKS